MLYVFAGFPRNGLHAGGIECAIECVEFVDVPQDDYIGIIQHGNVVQYRKEGVFALSEHGEEYLNPVEYKISDMCLRDGITWNWFPENWSFGNGVTISKTVASPTIKTVVHGTDLNMEEFLDQYGGTSEGLIYARKHVRHEAWKEYEARWVLGTCPLENHIVHLTSVVTVDPLPPFAYERIREIIETKTDLRHSEWYQPKHFAEVRSYNGNPYFHKG